MGNSPRYHAPHSPVTLVSVYATSMSATSDTKDKFYENLAAIISSVSNNAQLVLPGDCKAFGKKTHDWFDAKSTEMSPVIEAKRTALIEYKQSPSERNLQILRAARSKVQQTERRCANEYWTQISQDIKTTAITGNISGTGSYLGSYPGQNGPPQIL